jgi:23S rRNA (cytosine1962-C5)-methyltransferase
LPVYSFSDELLGHALMNNDTSIACRMVNFDSADPLTSIKLNIIKAINLRKALFNDSITNTYRLINGEGDNIPGLIVDRYNKVFVIQIVSSGIDVIKDTIVEIISKELEVDCIYEKSDMPARKKEGLEEFQGILMGKLNDRIEVLENGVKFIVDIKHSQKTGLFLDQREMRNLVGTYAKNKRVLNCFSYTGGFSLYAALNGAKSVTSVDIAKDAVELTKDNFTANNLPLDKHEFLALDVFEYLNSNNLDFDFVILDPPAFAKKKEDVWNAKKGYLNINRTALKKMPKSSFLLTCSCSYHVDQSLFESIVKQAALESKRNVKVLSKHRLASDHPINLFHSEMDYLKSLLLFVE